MQTEEARARIRLEGGLGVSEGFASLADGGRFCRAAVSKGGEQTNIAILAGFAFSFPEVTYHHLGHFRTMQGKGGSD